MIEDAVEFGFVPFGDGNRFRACGQGIPDLADEVQTLRRRELENLVKKCFRGHRNKITPAATQSPPPVATPKSPTLTEPAAP